MDPDYNEGGTQIHPEELDRLASLTSNFFLAADVKKIPLKRAEIAKLVPKEYMRKLGIVIEKASSKLQHIYGCHIVELKKKGSYILVNELGDELITTKLIQGTEKERLICGLRTMMLALIFMNGGVAQEGVMRTFMAKFGLDLESTEKMPVYGNIKLLTQEFARQCYLEIITVKDVDPPFKEYRWGERSLIELDKKKILGFVCQMYGDAIKPEMWINQYKEAYNDMPNEDNNEDVNVL